MLLKKLFRTLWHYKAQFISMVLMIALGVGVFLGFNIEWYSLEKNLTEIYEATGFADYRISRYGNRNILFFFILIKDIFNYIFETLYRSRV